MTPLVQSDAADVGLGEPFEFLRRRNSPSVEHCVIRRRTQRAGQNSWSNNLYRDPTTRTSPRCTINRYYDPATDQFLSVDPDVKQTDEPYVFTNDDPLNAEDPLGLCWGWCSFTEAAHDVATGFDATRHFVASHKVADGVALGLLSVATGGVALELYAAGEVGFGVGVVAASGVGAGFGAASLDRSACEKGSKVACGGAILGGIGAATGGAALLGPLAGMSAATAYRLTLLSLTTGAISTTYDIITKLISLISNKKKH